MAMLDRYKKTGGFNQLLTLLETCGPQKKVKFLEIIRLEDPRWADALEAKMIDLKRFLKWNDSAIAEELMRDLYERDELNLGSASPRRQTPPAPTREAAPAAAPDAEGGEQRVPDRPPQDRH